MKKMRSANTTSRHSSTPLPFPSQSAAAPTTASWPMKFPEKNSNHERRGE